MKFLKGKWQIEVDIPYIPKTKQNLIIWYAVNGAIILTVIAVLIYGLVMEF